MRQPDTRGLLLALLLCSAGLRVSAWQLPHQPAIMRDVTLIENQQHQRPFIPPLRTAADGRVGLNPKSIGGKLQFFLLVPEKLNAPFVDSPSGPEILSAASPYELTASQFYSAGALRHVTLCDPMTPFPEAGEQTNPYPCGGDDCYRFTVIAATHRIEQGNDALELWGTEVIARVANPKTAAAELISVTLQGAPTPGGTLFEVEDLFEPVVPRDGRLLVGRVGDADFEWTNPSTGLTETRFIDIVYSAYDESCPPCDVTKWTVLNPISHAHHDDQVNSRYGFAMHPIRDPEGEPIEDGHDLKASYPWIDREARNLFFTIGREQLFYTQMSQTLSRYPETCPPGVVCDPDPAGEFGGKNRGHGVVGLWTQGKMVLLDNLLNNIDYGLRIEDEGHRLVSLYQPGTGPGGSGSGDVRLGGGRDRNGNAGLAGWLHNSAFLDSLENLFNFQPEFQPTTPRDVVWLMSNGKVSDEVAFDDYLHPDGFILSSMIGAAAYGAETTGVGAFDYQDGWDGGAFTQPIKLQNAATALESRWKIPPHGRVFGGGRLEPAALGGVEGRGFWLDGATGVDYAVPAQFQDVSQADWHAGVYLDCRFSDDGAERLVLGFPDGSRILLRGLSAVIYRDAAGAAVNTIALPQALVQREWRHFGVQIADGGERVAFLLDGFQLNIWQAGPDAGLFQMTPGALSVGKIDGDATPGFLGWIDELNIFADSFNIEVACNLAGGTLVGFAQGQGGSWGAVAAQYPDWVHAAISEALANQGETAYDCYACYHDYSADDAAHLGNLPAGLTPLRHAALFPEGPLFHDASRPDSSFNGFCLDCHHQDGLRGLSLDALTLDAGETATTDPRRQPRQPFRRAFGHIPQNWLATGLPATAQVAPTAGVAIDPWLLASLAALNRETLGFTLVDPDTGADLAPLGDGDLVDLAALGVDRINVRANLNGPAGSVVFDWDGQPGFHVDNAAPYALFGYQDGAYLPGLPANGAYTLTATPYAGAGGTGGAGIGLSVSFTIRGARQTVADYRDDFQGDMPAPGWQCLWNEHGPIGDPVNYEPLDWNMEDQIYDSDGQQGLPDDGDMGWGSLSATGGRTGYGAGQVPGNGHDRYAIAAFTVAEDGFYAVTQSYVRAKNASGDGVEVRLYVDDRPYFQGVYPAGGSLSFNRALGWLQAGDVIYAAVGPNGLSASDAFDFDFSIDFAAPEIVADYRDDFQTWSPAAGWSYQWNDLGAIDVPANYVDLMWNGNWAQYDSDGPPTLPDNTNMGWGGLKADGGRTGYGVGQKVGNSYDRYAIAAFTVAQNGFYAILDSALRLKNSGSDGADLRLTVDGDEVLSFLATYDPNPAATYDFDAFLGFLRAGQTVYVAVGPNLASSQDAFELDFSVGFRAPSTVADYRDDYRTVSPAPGWRYLWNPGGAIGAAANYNGLWWDGAVRYDSDGVAGLPDATDMGWGRLFADGGYPGYGQSQTGNPDRYAIAAFTVRRNGHYALADSMFDLDRADATGVSLAVYVNDQPLAIMLRTPANDGEGFDLDLGWLEAGDTVYVAAGPDGDSAKDKFAWDFTLVLAH